MRRFLEEDDMGVSAGSEPALADGGSSDGAGVDTVDQDQDDLSVYGIAELRDGLTLEILQDQHSWLFNCDFKDAVIGINEARKLVWYDGEFLGGEWLGAEPAPSVASAGDSGVGSSDGEDEFVSECMKYGTVAAHFKRHAESVYGLSVSLGKAGAVLKGEAKKLLSFKQNLERIEGKGHCHFVGRDLYVSLKD